MSDAFLFPDPCPDPPPFLTPMDVSRMVSQKPLKRNPASRHYAENKAYREHRGYYYRDASGRWRTPDGKIAKGQSLETVRTERPGGGFSVKKRYVLERAVSYNESRRDRLLAIDSANAARERGIPARLRDYRAVQDRAEAKGEDPRIRLTERLLDDADAAGVDVSDQELAVFVENWGDTP